MLLEHDKLIGLPVQTQSKQALGKLDGLVFEIESQSIFQYIVRPAGITHIFDKELLINREQIISITDKKIIVEDAVYKSIQEEQKTKTQLQTEGAIK